MRKPDEPMNDDVEDLELMSEGELDVDGFMYSMEEETRQREAPRGPQRAGWQRVEDWRDARRLREQLDDWEDWEA